MHKRMWWLVLRVVVALVLVCPTQLTEAAAVPQLGAVSAVGDGTPGSCTEAAFDTALATESTVTFNCGAAPYTLTLAGEKTISSALTIEAGLPGQVTLSGANLTRLFSVTAAGTNAAVTPVGSPVALSVA